MPASGQAPVPSLDARAQAPMRRLAAQAHPRTRRGAAAQQEEDGLLRRAGEVVRPTRALDSARGGADAGRGGCGVRPVPGPLAQEGRVMQAPGRPGLIGPVAARVSSGPSQEAATRRGPLGGKGQTPERATGVRAIARRLSRSVQAVVALIAVIEGVRGVSIGRDERPAAIEKRSSAAPAAAREVAVPGASPGPRPEG